MEGSEGDLKSADVGLRLDLWSELDSEKPVPPGPDPIIRVEDIPPLQDVYCPRVVFRWFRLVVEGSQLEFEDCSDDLVRFGTPWFMDEFDIESVLGIGRDGESINWGLKNGVAPGQPFLLRIPQPHCSQTYYGEYDEEWDYELVRVLPKKPLSAAKSWQVAMARIEQNNLRHANFLEAEHARALRSPKTWKIDSWYYDNEGESCVALTLISSLPNHAAVNLASGRGPIRRHYGESAAFEALLKDFRTRHPTVPEDRVWDIVSRNFHIRPSVWDWLSGMSLIDDV